MPQEGTHRAGTHSRTVRKGVQRKSLISERANDNDTTYVIDTVFSGSGLKTPVRITGKQRALVDSAVNMG